MGTKIAVVGSRGFTNLKKVDEYIKSLPKDTIIVSGGAPGVDRTAERAARREGLRVEIFTAEWEKFKRRKPGSKNPAGMIRNTKIIETSDEVVAFWDGQSPGTRDSINKATKMGKKVAVIYDTD